MKRSIRPIALMLTLVAGVASTARTATACGGTFCDRGPSAMSVDQTGENIVFVMADGKVEAHIQIQYTGDAAHFSWIVPVAALPEIEVGSDALFRRLLAATVPTFRLTSQLDASCRPPAVPGVGGAADAAAASSSEAGVNVVLQKTVGAFEAAVLSVTSTADMLTWLETNGYQTPANAGPLFQTYVDKGFLFVGVKLTGGAGIDEIHPLVIRYAGTQPCVPLKLTAVAATEDMGVRTFFLGTRRVVPTNYKHVVVDPLLLDWLRLGTNYNDVVSRAVDSPVADGKAFVTEYAGSSAVVGATPLAPSNWNPDAFRTATPVQAGALLQSQGLMTCFGASCAYASPLLLPLLRQFLPAPSALVGDGGPGSATAEARFYACVSCYAAQVDASRWDGPAFAAALATRIVEPAKHADALLAAYPYLTRMFTRISPAEMTLDPEFAERDGLPPVSSSYTAQRRIACDGRSAISLPDGRQVALTAGGMWPLLTASVPAAERVEEFPASGPIVLVDNRARIDAALQSWNDSQSWPPTADGGVADGGVATPSRIDASADADASVTDARAGDGSPTVVDGSATADGRAPALVESGADAGDSSKPPMAEDGCSCRTARRATPGGTAALWAMLVAIATARRQRARAARSRRALSP